MTAARERLLAVLVLVALGAAAVLASTRTFATVSLAGHAPVVVAGSAAAPALAPLGIVLIALAASLTIAGRVARLVLGGVLVVLGAGIVLLTLPLALDPASGTAGSVSAAVGVTAGAGVTGLRGTAWAAVSVTAGALAALSGVAVLVRAPGWPTGGRRYRTAVQATVSADPVDEWDALTRGTDPTTAASDGLHIDGEDGGPRTPRADTA